MVDLFRYFRASHPRQISSLLSDTEFGGDAVANARTFTHLIRSTRVIFVFIITRQCDNCPFFGPQDIGLNGHAFCTVEFVSGTNIRFISSTRMATKDKTKASVAVIGTGHVSATDLYALLAGVVMDELILVGSAPDARVGELADLLKLVPLGKLPRIAIGRIDKAAEANVAILASTDDVSNPEASFAAIVRELKDNGFRGVMIVTHEPVERFAAIALAESNLPRGKVIGLWAGSNVSSAEKFAAPMVNQLTRSENEPGKHGIWCTASVADVRYIDSCTANCPYFEDILVSPGICASGMPGSERSPDDLAACVTQICHAVLNDTRSALPVFTFVSDHPENATRFVDRLSIIGHDGVLQVVDHTVKEPESGEFEADTLEKAAA